MLKVSKPLFFAQLIVGLHKKTYPLRRLLLLSLFGYINECKHKPPCSQFMILSVKKNGWKGFWYGLRRLISCF